MISYNRILNRAVQGKKSSDSSYILVQHDYSIKEVVKETIKEVVKETISILTH